MSETEERLSSEEMEVEVEVKEKEKKVGGRPKRQFTCTVCGDNALGYNFGAIVCESCKSFYRRHAHRRPKFRCLSNGTCQINELTRRFCASCRLKRCFAVGMRKPQPSESRNQSLSANWTPEKLNQRRLLMARLQERIASQTTSTPASSSPSSSSEDAGSPVASFTKTHSSSSLSGCSDETGSTTSAFKYDDLYEQIICAADAIQIRSRDCSAMPQECGNAGSRDAACVRLAFGNYVKALKQFPEFLQLGEETHRLLLSEHAIAQINLYAIFAVNADITGWCAIGEHGVPSEHLFTEFTDCMLRDGVDARPYVDLFQQLAALLRQKFHTDWPIVLVTLCMINLCSPSRRTTELTELTALRRTYECFLTSYLDQHYNSNFEELIHFCANEFPSALARLGEIQKHMLIQLATGRSARDKYEQLSNTPDIAIATLRIAELFEPVISEVARHLTTFEF